MIPRKPNPDAPITHRYWTGYSHPMAFFTGNSARDASSGQFIEWTDATLPKDCLNEVSLAQGKVRQEDEIRHKRNIVGWWLLREYGGYWVHHDILLFTPLSELPFPLTALHGEVKCTAFMGFPKHHPVPIQALEEIRAAPLSTVAPCPVVSGEQLLTRLAPDVPGLTFILNRDGHRVQGSDAWAVRLKWPGGRRWNYPQ